MQPISQILGLILAVVLILASCAKDGGNKPTAKTLTVLFKPTMSTNSIALTTNQAEGFLQIISKLSTSEAMPGRPKLGMDLGKFICDGAEYGFRDTILYYQVPRTKEWKQVHDVKLERLTKAIRLKPIPEAGWYYSEDQWRTFLDELTVDPK